MAVRVTGPPAMPLLTFTGDEPGRRPRGERFSTECAQRGLLLHPHHNWFLGAAHSDQVGRTPTQTLSELVQYIVDLLNSTNNINEDC